jgi:exodeoxyribonuclease VII small subunit
MVFVTRFAFFPILPAWVAAHRLDLFSRAIEATETAMPSFEDSLKKLETIVDQLEKGDLALEDSLKLFEEGVGLSAACKAELDAAEGKVQMLVKQRDGSLKPEPFLTEKQF